MKHRLPFRLGAILLAGLLLWLGFRLKPVQEGLPGREDSQRHLLRIWICSSPGGGEGWLRSCLKSWEKQHPGVMTFLRSVTPEELSREDAVLPDILLYTPGDVSAPETHFTPLTGLDGLREPLLRAGRWQGQQYGLPLCYAGYALAINSEAEPHLAVTPAPTTLLGRPAATSQPDATVTPGLPAQASLLAPKGCGLFTLSMLLTEPPTLGEDFAATGTGDVYTRFRARQADAALLTTGQITALNGVLPCRIITPDEIITDQVWFASLFTGADETAAQLLAYLVQPESQKLLSQQGLYTVREDLRLYATGTEGAMESAGRSLTAINAYMPLADVESAAWQVFHGRMELSDALLPLL